MLEDVYISKIVSGGQTGADRAALDFAIAHGIPHGGWCPKGREAGCRCHRLGYLTVQEASMALSVSQAA